MICYYHEELKFSIKVEIDQQDREPLNFQEMVQRTVNAEAKVGIKFSTIVRDRDGYCLRGHVKNRLTGIYIQTINN